ncbi:MAG: guanylate kinase [Planctomycetia bacterium]|nr:guanylate kinase [Planctomycetia bacterium]
MSKSGRLIILSGPSGVGKSTIRDLVVARSPITIHLSVSATTRAPRLGERDGVDYFFLSNDEFQNLRQQDQFVECQEVFGRNIWYGTLRREVEQHLSAGVWVLLEIDVDGAREVVKKYPDAITIFIAPRSLEALEERLRSRGTESEEAMRHRLARAEYEINQSAFYKYNVVNDVLETAVHDFCEIIRQEEFSGGTK